MRWTAQVREILLKAGLQISKEGVLEQFETPAEVVLDEAKRAALLVQKAKVRAPCGACPCDFAHRYTMYWAGK